MKRRERRRKRRKRWKRRKGLDIVGFWTFRFSFERN